MRKRKISSVLGLAASIAMLGAGVSYAQDHSHCTKGRIQGIDKLLSKKDRIIGIEVLIAGSGESMPSKWGHGLFRFVDNDAFWTNDLVLGFAAQVEPDKISYVDGIFGGYNLIGQVMTLSEAWENYVAKEGRPLERYIIPTTPAIRTKLIASLETWCEDPSKTGNYTFLNNNCSRALVRFLNEVPELRRHVAGYKRERVQSKGQDIYRKRYSGPEAVKGPLKPIGLKEYVVGFALSPYPSLVFDSWAQTVREAQALLGLTQRDFELGTNWPADAAARILSKFDEKQVKRLMANLTMMPPVVFDDLVKVHNYRTGKVSFAEVMGEKSPDPSIYQLCSDHGCGEKVVKEARRIWGKEVFAGLKPAWQESLRIFTHERSTGFFESVTVEVQPDADLYREHYRILEEQGEKP